MFSRYVGAFLNGQNFRGIISAPLHFRRLSMHLKHRECENYYRVNRKRRSRILYRKITVNYLYIAECIKIIMSNSVYREFLYYMTILNLDLEGKLQGESRVEYTANTVQYNKLYLSGLDTKKRKKKQKNFK